MALEASEGLRSMRSAVARTEAIRKYPVDCRLIEVASSGMLLGRGSAVLDACGRRRTRQRLRRGRWGR